MTQTTNIGLKKIDGSENWRQIFDYHNDSADKTDSAVSAVQDGIAIVANGDTHAAVEEGQFVYVRNHSTLAEGLYKAASAIGTNGELTTSNLTADSSGGLNDLQEQITALNSKLGSYGMYTDDSVTTSKLPSEFNVGITYTSTGSTSTFPKTYGFVWTNRYSDNRVAQINFGNAQIAYRFSTSSSSWSGWYNVGLTLIN